MAMIRVGAAYINSQTVRMITATEKGTEEDKKFGINVITNCGNYCMYCDSRAERNETIQRILDLVNGPDEKMIEIRKQLAAINSRINAIDRKLAAIKEGKK